MSDALHGFPIELLIAIIAAIAAGRKGYREAPSAPPSKRKV
jgi:hypothetical protein